MIDSHHRDGDRSRDVSFGASLTCVLIFAAQASAFVPVIADHLHYLLPVYALAVLAAGLLLPRDELRPRGFVRHERDGQQPF